MESETDLMSLSLSDVIGNLGDYTLDCILVTKAEPLGWPEGPEIVWCNRSFTDMTGYELTEIIGKTPRLLQGDLTDKEAISELGRKLRNWEHCKFDLYNYRKDGTGFWVELSIFPVKDEKGWFCYWVSVQRDITKRKHRELELERANKKIKEYQKDLEAFSYAAFHDIRSPLRIVSSMMEIIKEDAAISSLSGDTQEILDIVQKRINRMRSLVQDISKYVATQEIGAGPPSKIVVQPWLEQIFDDLNPLGMHKLHLSAGIDEIFVPKNELQTIFTNLFDNAIKHSTKDQTNVFVYVYQLDGFLNIYVDDDGVGIAEGARSSVFTFFAKGNDNQSNDGSGFGLGFVRQLTLRNGGSVHIEDSPQGGARFVVRWLI